MNHRLFHRTLLASGSLLLLVSVFLFSQLMISRLSREVTTTSRVLASFLARSSFPAINDPDVSQIVRIVISNIDFPIVITDTLGTPRAWKRISVPDSLISAETLDSLARGMPISPVKHALIDRVIADVRALDRHNQPLEMRHQIGWRIGEVHYGEPRALRDLRWVPVASVGGVLLLLTTGFFGLATLRDAERRTIWVGMAKETAHQLGTPLSSLMGWADLLREQAVDGASLPAATVNETVREMQRDIERLNKVAQRFSRVGSEPALERLDVRPIVHDVVSYMRRRLPRGGSAIELVEKTLPVASVLLNAELMEWALENLITNAITALDQRPGIIQVEVHPTDDGGVEITVADTGRGMTRAEQRRAFEPGYTTRRRGWGLGLPLARRVVEEYHRGRLFVKRSVPGEGTTMAIRLPAIQPSHQHAQPRTTRES